MKKFLSFEFWQKFGKALMVVIAVMPAAGLMISIGKTLAISFASIPFLVTTGGVLENIGWAIIVNLHILFALAIGGTGLRTVRAVPSQQVWPSSSLTVLRVQSST